MKRNSVIKFLLIPVAAYALLGCSRADFEPDELTVETSTAAVGPFVPFGDPNDLLAAILGTSMITSMKSPSILYTPEDTDQPFKIWYERPPDGIYTFFDVRLNPIEFLGVEIFSGTPPSSIGLATATDIYGKTTNAEGTITYGYTDQGVVLAGSDESCDLNDPDVIPIETSTGTALLMFLTMICDDTTPQIHLCIDETGNGDSWNCVDGDSSSTSTNDPIIPVGSGDDCDAGGAYAPSVIRDGDTLRMVYSGWDGNEDYCLLYAEATIEDGVELNSQSFTTATGWTKGGILLTQSNETDTFDEGFVGHPSFVKDTTELGEPICKIYYTGCTGGIPPTQSLEDYAHMAFYDCSIGFSGTFQSDCKTEYQRRSDIILPTLIDTLTANPEEIIQGLISFFLSPLLTNENRATCDELIQDFLATIASTNNSITIEDCDDLVTTINDAVANQVGQPGGAEDLSDILNLDEITPAVATINGSTYLFYGTGVSILLNAENTAGLYFHRGILAAKFTPS